MNKNFISNLPKHFGQHTLDVCGEQGEIWLNDLPEIIDELAAKWSLKVEKSFPNLSYNFVAPCVCTGGGGAVLKIALPLNSPEIFNEAKFLQMADGSGAVRLLEIDQNHRAILLERLTPGANLKEVCRDDDTQAVEIMIQILNRLLKETPENCDFQQLEEWFNNFFSRAEKTIFPREFTSKAREFFEQLNSASTQKFLIHGDLHHENILSAQREPFLAIDPKGIVGTIGYEISIFLNNHALWLASDANCLEKLNKSVHSFSKAFEIEPENLCRWAFTQMVLSAWWTFEDNEKDWKIAINRAEIWEKIGI